MDLKGMYKNGNSRQVAWKGLGAGERRAFKSRLPLQTELARTRVPVAPYCNGCNDQMGPDIQYHQ